MANQELIDFVNSQILVTQENITYGEAEDMRFDEEIASSQANIVYLNEQKARIDQSILDLGQDILDYQAILVILGV